jgi:dTDP-4-amino-4,6-dideoxygalactose transaminase
LRGSILKAQRSTFKTLPAEMTPNSRVVMPVHYASYPGDLDAVYDFAKSNNLRVIEDAAHALRLYI